MEDKGRLAAATEGGALAWVRWVRASSRSLPYSPPYPRRRACPRSWTHRVDRSWCHATLPPALASGDPLRELEVPIPKTLGLVDLAPLLCKEGSREHSCVPLNRGCCLHEKRHHPAGVIEPDQQEPVGLPAPRGQGGVCLRPGGHPGVSRTPCPQCGWQTHKCRNPGLRRAWGAEAQILPTARPPAGDEGLNQVLGDSGGSLG